uniref:Uncharacterized protein n=1 Tax=Anguilla anguilla TaxID=7936 RepID=A0A0E9SI02_ANGAN
MLLTCLKRDGFPYYDVTKGGVSGGWPERTVMTI